MLTRDSGISSLRVALCDDTTLQNFRPHPIMQVDIYFSCCSWKSDGILVWDKSFLGQMLYLCMVVAAVSELGCLGMGATFANSLWRSLLLFWSGVLGFNDGYKSMLDLTSCWTPRDDTIPLLWSSWDDVPTIPSPQDATAMLVVLFVVGSLWSACGLTGANLKERKEKYLKISH